MIPDSAPGELAARPMVAVRPAMPSDSRAIWEWRNDPVTRSQSFTTDEVPWADHEQWFARALANSDRHLLIGEIDREPIGVVRFDWHYASLMNTVAGDPAVGAHTATRTAHWEISINLAPAWRGKGLAVPLINAAQHWLAEHESQRAASEVIALIRPENTASLRVFSRAGYNEVPAETTAPSQAPHVLMKRAT